MSGKKILFIFIFTGLMVGVSLGGTLAVMRDLPEVRELAVFAPPAITRIWSADGVLLAELFAERRRPLKLKDVPEHLKKAVIATEDRSFFTHPGIDLKGILRAAVRDVTAGRYVEGGSTITQQLAKTLFLTPAKSIVRKIKEGILALQIEKRYTKAEILELYLNQIYFGSGAYGVESAAETFFGKRAGDLNLNECALIAGMPKSPSVYSPFVNRKLALGRMRTVLKQMLETGGISEAEYERSAGETPVFRKKGRIGIKAPYFVDYVKDFVKGILGPAGLYKKGLDIHTTLSHRLQTAAEKAVAAEMPRLEERMKKRGVEEPYPQAAFVAMEAGTGGILAMIGGREYAKSPYNRAWQTKRQPGSAFKPFVYALAVERGLEQTDLILDAPLTLRGAEKGSVWRPENFSRRYSGKITLREALARSKNTAAVRLAAKFGVGALADFARSLGIKSKLELDLSLALGSGEVSLLDLLEAYGVFPAGGLRVAPHGVARILDRSGRTVFENRPRKEHVMSRTSAAIVTDMLAGVVKEGTAWRAKVLNGEVAGKTGTTSDYRDALFAGFSPSIVAAAWVGNDEASTLGPGETGARVALPIWTDFMREALETGRHDYFDIPDGVMRVEVERRTGRVVSEGGSGAETVRVLKRRGRAD